MPTDDHMLLIATGISYGLALLYVVLITLAARLYWRTKSNTSIGLLIYFQLCLIAVLYAAVDYTVTGWDNVVFRPVVFRSILFLATSILIAFLFKKEDT